MSWLTILLFILKYGPAIFELVKSIFDLIEWLRERDPKTLVDKVGFKSAYDRKELMRALTDMAAEAKRQKDTSALVGLRDKLAARRAELEKTA